MILRLLNGMLTVSCIGVAAFFMAEYFSSLGHDLEIVTNVNRVDKDVTDIQVISSLMMQLLHGYELQCCNNF